MTSFKRKPAGLSRLALFAVLLLAGCGDKPEELVASAKQYIDRQDFNSAIIQLKNALSAKPDYAEARYLLGVSQLKVNDVASAEKELRKAQQLGYPAEKTSPPLAEALLNLGKPSAVISEFQSATLSDPRAEAHLRVQVGNAFLALNEANEARDSFAKALVSEPGNAVARIGQARLLGIKGKLEEAQRIVDEVLTASPQQVEAISLKADLAFAQGQPDKQVEQLRQLVQLTPNSVGNRFRLGLALLRRGDPDKELSQQVEAMKKIAARDPRTLHLQSVLELNRGNSAAARDLALNVLRTEPDYVPALVMAGTTSLRLHAYNQAQDNLRKVLALTPTHLYARKLLAAAYLRSGDIGRASRTVEEGLKQTPNDGALLALAGEVALARGEMEAAAGYYERAAQISSGNVGAINRLAQLRFAEGHTEDALQTLEAGSAASQTHYQSDLTLALYYALRAKPEKALSWIDSIEKKQPNNPIVPALRGLVYAQKKDRGTARRHFERAVELQANFAPALEGLAALDVLDKKPDAAHSRFEAALAKDPKAEAVALSYVKFLRSQRAPVTKIVDVLQRTIRSEPMALNARIALTQAYLGINDTAKAVTAAQEVLAAAPEDPRLLQMVGQAQFAAKHYNEAVSAFEKVVASQPQDPQPLLLLAEAYHAAGDQHSTLDALQRALRIKPDLLAAQIALIRVQFEAGRADEALEVARTIQKQRPKQSVGYMSEADIRQQTKHWKERAMVLERGLKQTSSPSFVPPLHIALINLGRQSDADELIGQWFKNNPNDVQIRSYLAERALARKDYGSAIRSYKEILSIQPDTPLVLNNLAWSAHQMKDPKALEYAEQANRLRPNTPGIMDTLGWILVEQGQVAPGLALLQKAVELAPGALSIRLNLAKALIRAGQKDAARKELEYLTNNVKDAQAKAEVAALAEQP